MPDDLQPRLNLFDATMINVGTVIGSAIFIVPGTIALYTGSLEAIMAVWMLAGAVSILGALTFAELAAVIPRAGGMYQYLKEAYSPLYGFLYGWAGVGVINTASIAAIAVGMAGFIGFFTPLTKLQIHALAIASIAVLTIINILGVKEGAWFQNLLTVAKLVALLILVGFSFTAEPAPQLHASVDVPATLGSFGLAVVAALWAYDGWNEITYAASEVRDPEKNLPWSIIFSVLIVVVVYILVNLAYANALSVPAMAASRTVGSDAAVALLGEQGAVFITLAIVVALIGTNNGIVLTTARIPFAMARDGHFFNMFGAIHPKLATPWIALLFQGIWSSVLVLSGSYDQLITYVVFSSFVFYGMSAVGLFRLRRKFPASDRPYRTWGYPGTPILFALASAVLVINTIVEAPMEAAVGSVIILSGVPVFFFLKSRQRAA